MGTAKAMRAAESAVEEGRQAYIRGDGNNPYKWGPYAYRHEAWLRGYAEAARAALAPKEDKP